MRKWGGDKFLDAVEVPAFRTKIGDKDVVYLKPRIANQSPPKSEIAFGDATYIVTESKANKSNFLHTLNYVTKKEPEKKP